MLLSLRIGVVVSPLLLAPAAAIAQSAPDTPVRSAPTLRFSDFDNDGLIDVYAVRPMASDRLYKNFGDGTFGDVSDALGLSAISESRFALWLDFDGDGWLDLYVCAANGASRLVRNDQGRAFVDVTSELGVAHDHGSELFAESFDFDLDGWTDLRVVTATGELLFRNLEGVRFELVDLGFSELAAGPEVIVIAPPPAPRPVATGEPSGREPEPGTPRPSAPTASSGGTGAVSHAPFAPALAPIPAGSAALTPTLICAGSVKDRASGACVQASSVPTLGELYPLSTYFNVDATGKVGMGTAAPTAGLHVTGQSGLLATGTYAAGSIPTQGLGVRMMWYPARAVFRAGRVLGTNWDDANVGEFSIAMGFNPLASGVSSTALGYSAQASGPYSTAIGTNAEASGDFGTAIGTATEASGAYSVALGLNTDADSYCSTVTGRYNVGGGDPANWNASDPLFEIGIGTSPVARANALTVLKSGRVGIGRTPAANVLEVEGNASKTSAGSWLANSDRRIKTDVREIEGALDVLDRVRPVAFRYTDEYRSEHPSIEDKDYYNVIAQEFAEVFPAYVQRSGEGDILQVDTYPALIHALAAVRELRDVVRTQADELTAERGKRDAEVAALRSEVTELRRLVESTLAARDRGDSRNHGTAGYE